MFLSLECCRVCFQFKEIAFKYSSSFLEAAQPRLTEAHNAEPSEELRVELLSLLHIVVSSMHFYTPEQMEMLVFILCKSVVDPFHECRKQGLVTLRLVAKTQGRVFKQYAQMLMTASCASLTHKHSQVRALAVKVQKTLFS